MTANSTRNILRLSIACAAGAITFLWYKEDSFVEPNVELYGMSLAASLCVSFLSSFMDGAFSYWSQSQSAQSSASPSASVNLRGGKLLFIIVLVGSFLFFSGSSSPFLIRVPTQGTAVPYTKADQKKIQELVNHRAGDFDERAKLLGVALPGKAHKYSPDSLDPENQDITAFMRYLDDLISDLDRHSFDNSRSILNAASEIDRKMVLIDKYVRQHSGMLTNLNENVQIADQSLHNRVTASDNREVIAAYDRLVQERARVAGDVQTAKDALEGYRKTKSDENLKSKPWRDSVLARIGFHPEPPKRGDDGALATLSAEYDRLCQAKSGLDGLIAKQFERVKQLRAVDPDRKFLDLPKIDEATTGSSSSGIVAVPLRHQHFRVARNGSGHDLAAFQVAQYARELRSRLARYKGAETGLEAKRVEEQTKSKTVFMAVECTVAPELSGTIDWAQPVPVRFEFSKETDDEPENENWVDFYAISLGPSAAPGRYCATSTRIVLFLPLGTVGDMSVHVKANRKVQQPYQFLISKLWDLNKRKEFIFIPVQRPNLTSTTSEAPTNDLLMLDGTFMKEVVQPNRNLVEVLFPVKKVRER